MAVLIAGYLMSSTKTISMTKANGKAPRKTSLSLMRSSFNVDLITKQLIPKGGVNKPISAPTTVMIPNHTGLRPMTSISGRNKGTTIRMIYAVSSKVPRNNIRMT